MNEENKNGEKKKRRFNIYNLMYGRDGRGVRKKDVIKNYNFRNFFKLFGRKFRYIVNTNLIYIVGNFPIFFFLFAISGNFSRHAVLPMSEMYSVLYGISTASADGISMLPVSGIHGLMGSFPVSIGADNLFVKILYGLSLLILITFGFVNAGCAYIMRNVIKGEPIFLWQDFFGTIKKNWKQAIPVGVLDAAVFSLCLYAVYYYYITYTVNYIMFFCSLVTLAVYTFMRFYMYLIMVTFDMGILKIIKNSFIFSILCIGKNFLALFGILLLIFLTMFFAAVYTPLGIIILLVLFFGAMLFISTYVAYPQMKKYMIDPYYKDAESYDDEAESETQGKTSEGYGEDDGELYDAGEYITDEDEFKTRKKDTQ